VPNVAGQNAMLDRPIITPSELPSLLSRGVVAPQQRVLFPSFPRAESRIFRAPYNN